MRLVKRILSYYVSRGIEKMVIGYQKMHASDDAVRTLLDV
jgi:hypothetical protein